MKAFTTMLALGCLIAAGCASDSPTGQRGEGAEELPDGRDSEQTEREADDGPVEIKTPEPIRILETEDVASPIDGRDSEQRGRAADEDPVAIKTPEIIRILETEDIARLMTSHRQTIYIRLKDGRRYRGTYVHADAGRYAADANLSGILNLVMHIKANRPPDDVKDWSIICE